ncbi:MAG: flagellar brake protein [Bacillota bacterium]
MAENALEINQKIQLEIDRGPYQGTFPSKIADIEDEVIKVVPPYDKGELLPLRRNLELKVYFTGDDAAFYFESKVIGREREPIPLIVLTPPETLKRIQRRNYFRLEVSEPIYYRRLDEEEEPLEEFRESKTVDVSGGGVKMVLDQPLEADDLLELYLNIPDIDDVPILGKVRQIYTLPDDYTKAAGIEFIRISSRIRDTIVGWLFDYQRKLRRRGLL